MKLKVKVNEYSQENSVSLNIGYKQSFNLKNPLCLINNQAAFNINFSNKIPKESVQINNFMRRRLFGDADPDYATVGSIQQKNISSIANLKLHIQLITSQKVQIKTSEFQKALKQEFSIINHNTYFFMRFKGFLLEIRAHIQDNLSNNNNIKYGLIKQSTVIALQKLGSHKNILIVYDNASVISPFKQSHADMKNLKVGGLKDQLQQIERRIFSVRMVSQNMASKIGMKPVKGMLLYGPPGTGKTLIAREISEILKLKAEVVNGPQIFDQMVGNSEKKIRALFQKPVQEQKTDNTDKNLYCIIFDEIDAICKKRGSTNSHQVYDNIVNQLLTCIDGVFSLNNILVIGITNRKDLLDEAILRPGRLEVHIEVNLPDEAGRQEILIIHTKELRDNHFLDDTVNFKELAKLSNNFTGAELQGAVKSAQTFALEQMKKGSSDVNEQRFKMTQAHFVKGIKQINPQFGKDNSQLENIIPKDKIKIPKYEKIKASIMNSIESIENGKHTFLIRGDAGCGKTTLALECALSNNATYVKHISCDNLVGMDEGQIITQIVNIFEDSQKCDESLIILDDFFRLIDFIPLGPRYNTNILNVLINLIKKTINPKRKQIIIATASKDYFFEGLGLLKYFNYKYMLDRLNIEEIANTLTILGYDGPSSMKIARRIESSTIKDIRSVTQIQKTKNPDHWLSSWDEIRQDF